jgi:hypothetical protein
VIGLEKGETSSGQFQTTNPADVRSASAPDETTRPSSLNPADSP